VVPALKPVLFVTNHAPPARVRPFQLLHEREGVLFALFGGRTHHAAATADADPPDLTFPHRRVTQREVRALAASGDFRAVVCGTAGRVALPGAYAGARSARVPFVLWTSLWAQPHSLAGIAGALPLRRIYRGADAVATYGRHVSEYVEARGARNVFVAPQTVDNEFWGTAVEGTRYADFQTVFSGRLDREKGHRALIEAWQLAGLDAPGATLVLVGPGPERARAGATRTVRFVGPATRTQVRNFYGGADVLVVPSLRTRTFREPWGLVVNEAMNQGLPVIATDAVGAAAGDLVRHEHNGLIVPAGDAEALARALRRLHDDPGLRARLGAQAREDVRAYTADAWAEGIGNALDAARRTGKA
jgi:glycosyltransferase involved in cell wall biosynthesis